MEKILVIGGGFRLSTTALTMFCCCCCFGGGGGCYQKMMIVFVLPEHVGCVGNNFVAGLVYGVGVKLSNVHVQLK